MPHTIASGTRLGPYEILELIGRGGMGEVYRAQDARLGRAVAVKILPKSFIADPSRLKRFEREARSAGQLNHPNIVAIYDVGLESDVPYIVSELLEGTDLRSRLSSGALPPRKAIAIAMQIAKGLAAAHAKQIIHRDLKPENVMISSSDGVKIVDFGLAKLTHKESSDSGDDTATIAPHLTETGAIMGTASYMAPEQIRQLPVDHRADLFAFGAILYEMLAGHRAFDGPTPADRISAILNTTPEELPAEVNDAIPELTRLVDHCLEKNAENRFQTAQDLVFSLLLLDSASASKRGTSGNAGNEQPGQAPLSRSPDFRRVTYREGSILTARFAADGQSICYGAAWEGRPVELFWAYPGNPESRPLGYPGTDILAISRSGEMAVSLKRRALGGFLYRGMLARMPAGGGAARQVLDGVLEADWSPDGRQLAIVREEAGMAQIEYPIGTVMHKTGGWVSHMRVSPDGAHVAFIEHSSRGNDAGGPAVVDRNGKVRVLSMGWSSARGLAWSPDGREIVFTAYRAGVGRSLHATTIEGNERPLLQVPGHLTLADISSHGSVLVSVENQRLRSELLRSEMVKPMDLSWLDWTMVRTMSEDGTKILFDETNVGGGELHSTYLRETDGSPAVRLGDGQAVDLSPDGQWALAAVGYFPTRLSLLPCGPGEARIIPTGAIDVTSARWLPDGVGICILGHEPGHGLRLYRLDPATGQTTPVSEEGISSQDLLMSPDGTHVAAFGPDRSLNIYPLDGGPPRSVPGKFPIFRTIRWSADGTGIFVFERGTLPAKLYRVDLESGERQLWKELAPWDPIGVEGMTAVAMTANGDPMAYSFVQRLSDLFVVDGLF